MTFKTDTLKLWYVIDMNIQAKQSVAEIVNDF